MNWKTYEPKQSRCDGILVNRRYLTMTRATFTKLGSPKSISLDFDKAAGAIRITSGDAFPVKFPEKAPRINCSISEVMPLGRYLATDANGIFIKPTPSSIKE